jgi:transposase
VVTTVSFRKEIVTLAKRTDANIREIGRRFKVSPKTIYKWLGRQDAEGEEGLRDRSRRPHRSPTRYSAEMESKVLGIRDHHPAWGARKIGVRLKMLGESGVPVDSTIHEIPGIGETHGLAAIRARRSESTVADGFQGMVCDRKRGAVSPAHHPG